MGIVRAFLFIGLTSGVDQREETRKPISNSTCVLFAKLLEEMLVVHQRPRNKVLSSMFLVRDVYGCMTKLEAMKYILSAVRDLEALLPKST